MYISRRFLLLSCVMIFAVSPLTAVILKQTTNKDDEILSTEIQPATKEDLLAAIKRANDNPVASEQFEEIAEITSMERMNTWWYVATVKIAVDSNMYDPGPQGMLFAKFTDKPNSVLVVTKPGERFAHYNISGSAGVPYDVIDRLNEVNDASK